MALLIIEYIIQVIGFVAAFTAAYLVFKKDPSYIGNRLMASANTSIGIYFLSIFIYKMIQEIEVVLVLFPLAMVCTLVSTLLLYLTMQIMVKSSQWLQTTKKWMLIVGVIAFYCLYLIFGNVMTVVNVSTGNVQMNLLPLIGLLGLVVFFLVSSIRSISKFGIKKSEGLNQQKMIRFRLGLIIVLVAVGVNVPANLVANETLGKILDIIYFAIMASANVVVPSSYLMKNDENSKEKKNLTI